MSCNSNQLEVEVYETSASGNKLTKLTDFESSIKPSEIILNPNKTYQTITGFGGSFTESSAYLLNRLSKPNRDKILQAYFGEEGARYSLTRTHIASCDFSKCSTWIRSNCVNNDLNYFRANSGEVNAGGGKCINDRSNINILYE